MNEPSANDPLAWRGIKAPSLGEIEVIAQAAFRRLPQRFRALCDGLVIQVDDFPEEEVLNELAAQKLTFDFEMSRVLRANQDATATLISTSLQEVKNDLSERMSKQEQFRWESGGKQQGIGSLAATAFSVISLAIALGSLGFMVARHQ